MQYTVYVILAPLVTAVSVGVIVYLWRYRAAPGALILMGQMVAVSGWLILNTLELMDGTEAGTLLWARLSYLFFTFAPVAWFAFALQYTGRASQSHWLTSRRLGLLGIVPLTTTLLAQTNAHSLIWRSYQFTPVNGLLAVSVVHGPWFWVHIAYTYFLVLLGAFLIGKAYFKSFSLYRRQSIWLIIGAVTPLITNIIYVFHLIPGLRKDYSPLSFAFAGIAFAIGVLRYQLFDLKPVARETLIDRMSDGMLVLDEQDRIVDINPAAHRMIGVTNGDPIGQPLAQVLGPLPPSVEQFRHAMDLQTDIAVGENGRTRHYNLKISPLTDRRGRLTGRLVVWRDITDRKQAEAALGQQALKLQAQNEELDAFAHTVAHDLNAPLSTIIGFAEILDDACAAHPSDDLREYSGIIARNGRKMANIIDELLLLAGVRKQEVPMSPLDMAGIVSKSQQRLAYMIEEYRAEIITPAEDAWPSALGYGPWVEEIWINYLSNAMKYGGRPPRVELGGAVQADGLVHFWVRDNGAGLTPAEQARLFAPFTQLNHVRVKGHGLGLSIVKRIAERLGGQVWVESSGAPGQGSTFYFSLPAAELLEGGQRNGQARYR